MSDIVLEKRLYPRIRTELNLDICKNIKAKTLDVSEGGLSFSCVGQIPVDEISVQLHWPQTRFGLESRVRLIWEQIGRAHV